MRVHKLNLFLLLLVSGSIAYPQQTGEGTSLDDLIKDVLGENPQRTKGPQINPGPLPTSPPVGPADNDNQGVRNTKDAPNENTDCKCVPYYLCPNGTVLTDGTGLLDIRAKPGVCDEYMDVCCKEPLDENNPITPPPTERRGCGQRHPDGIGFRITGDYNNEAQFGEFPWMVALLKRTVLDDGSDLMLYQCGGALIHEKVVLTAAHCITSHKDEGELVARVGEWDTQTTNEVYKHQNIKVAKVILHPAFQKGNLHNDFALLILEKPVTLGDNVDTVCLPTTGYVPLSRECYATGWGKDKFDEDDKPNHRGLLGLLTHRRVRIPRQLTSLLSGIRQKVHERVQNHLEALYQRTVGSVWPSHGKKKKNNLETSSGVHKPGEKGVYQVILKKIDLPIVPKDHCINLLRKTRLGPFFKLHESFVCAGGVVGKDTCKGDGGSPLVCPIDGKPGTYEVTGLVAWGIGCGDETPGVYAGVAYARAWIDQELSRLGIQV